MVKILNTDITLVGTWNVAEAYSEWFDTTGAYHNNIIANLAVLSKTIKLKEGSTFVLKKLAQRISIDTLYSDSGKATLSFDCGSEGEYNDNNGLWIESFNFLLKNIKVTSNFDPSTTNTQTLGNALAVSYNPRNKDVSAKIINCEFTGSFSSSCFASSDTTDLVVDECNFHDIYLADHAVYCSTYIRNYTIQNTNVNNVSNVATLFKVRESPIFKFYIFKNNIFVDHKSYVVDVYLYNNYNGGTVVIENIKTSKTSNDKTRGTFMSLGGSGNSCLSSLIVSNSDFLDGGTYTDNVLSDEYPLINHNGSDSITVGKIAINNCTLLNYSLTAPGELEMHNSKVTLGLPNSLLSAYLTALRIYDSEINTITTSYLTYHVPNIVFERCKVTSNASYLIRLKGDAITPTPVIIIKDCYLKNNGNYFYISSSTPSYRFYFFDENNIFDHNESSIPNEVSNTTEMVILNRLGADPGDLMRGYCYFEKLVGKPIWWNGTAWVDATGTSV